MVLFHFCFSAYKQGSSIKNVALEPCSQMLQKILVLEMARAPACVVLPQLVGRLGLGHLAMQLFAKISPS